jgi:hypothetical protein
MNSRKMADPLADATLLDCKMDCYRGMCCNIVCLLVCFCWKLQSALAGRVFFSIEPSNATFILHSRKSWVIIVVLIARQAKIKHQTETAFQGLRPSAHTSSLLLQW